MLTLNLTESFIHQFSLIIVCALILACHSIFIMRDKIMIMNKQVIAIICIVFKSYEYFYTSVKINNYMCRFNFGLPFLIHYALQNNDYEISVSHLITPDMVMTTIGYTFPGNYIEKENVLDNLRK